MAYAQQLQQTAPLSPTHQLEQPVRRRSPGPVLLGPAPLVTTCRDDISPRPAARACWAKKLAGKTKHNDPIANQAIELSSRALSSAAAECSASTSQHSSMNHRSSKRSHAAQNLPLDSWSPPGSCRSSEGGGCSSSEENNSPTDLNSCKQIKDKPPLLKNLEVVQESTPGDDSFSKDLARPSSGGCLNESSAWEGAPTLRVSKFSSRRKADGFSHHKKYSLGASNQTPTAPPTDEESPLESSTDQSKRSSRSSCDHSMPSSSSSLSDTTNFSERSETSSCCKNKRISHSCCACSSSSVTPPPP
ncbi:hypothetical protein X975_23012, partial [Stegodyphus mimosarum]